jgi:hypothetical protein
MTNSNQPKKKVLSFDNRENCTANTTNGNAIACNIAKGIDLQ